MREGVKGEVEEVGQMKVKPVNRPEEEGDLEH